MDLPLWWRRYDTCKALGWTPAEYEAMPVRLIAETEYALGMERRHQSAESDRQWTERSGGE